MNTQRIFTTEGRLIGFVTPHPVPGGRMSLMAVQVAVHEGAEESRLVHRGLGYAGSMDEAVALLATPPVGIKWRAGEKVVGHPIAVRLMREFNEDVGL